MKYLEPEEGYDLYAADYKKDHAHLDSFDWEECRALILEAHADLRLRHGPEARLQALDLGCGDGRILKRLGRHFAKTGEASRLGLHGWDSSAGMLAQARKNLGKEIDANLEKRDLLELGAGRPISGFHLIWSLFVLVHVKDPSDFFRCLARLLAEDGLAVFNSFPQKEAPLLESGGKRFVIEHYDHDPARIRQALEEEGLRVVRETETQWSLVFLVGKEKESIGGSRSTRWSADGSGDSRPKKSLGR